MNFEIYTALIMIAILTSLVIYMIYSKKSRFNRISNTTLAAALVSIMVVGMVLTSPTAVKAISEVTTISTITEKSSESLESTFTTDDEGLPFYEDNLPTEIVVEVGTETLTFTNIETVSERTEGPYPVIDETLSNTILFYEGSGDPGDDIPDSWILHIPDGQGGYLQFRVPAHDVELGTELGAIEASNMKIFYYDANNNLIEFTGETFSYTRTVYDEAGNPISFQEGSDEPLDEEDIPSGWVIRIYYGTDTTEFIEVPAHEVVLGTNSRTLDTASAGETYYYYKDGNLYQYIWDGGAASQTVQGPVQEKIVSGTDTSYSPIYFFEQSATITGGDIPPEWVLYVPDPLNPGEFIEVDPEEVWVGNDKGPIEASDMKIFYYTDTGGGTSELVEFTGQSYSYTRTVYEGSDTVLLYEGSDDPGNDVPETWVLRIYYGTGTADYIEVPAHDVNVGNMLGGIETDGMKLYYYMGGQLYEFIGEDLHDLYYEGSDDKPLFKHAGELPTTEGEIPAGWVLRIYYTTGTEYIEVPAHIPFTINTVHVTETGPYTSVFTSAGSWWVELPDGETVPASRVEEVFGGGVERLFFSLVKPGESVWIGPDDDQHLPNTEHPDLDGNDIFEYSGGVFSVFFDIDDIVSPQSHTAYEIDAASIICGEQLYFSTEQPGSIDEVNDLIQPSGWGTEADDFEKHDIIKYDFNTGDLEIYWSPEDAGVANPDDIDAVSVRDIDDDGTLEVLFSIKGSSGDGDYPPQSGKMTAADIFVWDPDDSEFSKVLEDGANTISGDDPHFDYKPHAPSDIDAMEVLVIGGDADQYLLSFHDVWYVAGKNDDPMGTYAREDIIFYDAGAKTASMIFDGSEYLHGGGVDIDAVSYCGTILEYRGWVYLYDAQGTAHLYDAQGKPHIFDAQGRAIVEAGEDIVVFDAVGKAYIFDAQGYAYIYDLRGETIKETVITRYIVKSTTPYTPQTQPEIAQFITCYNYTNSTTTITLEHTKITSTYEVCLDYGTTTTRTSIIASIVYSNLLSSNNPYMPLLIIGLLGFLWLYNLARDRKSNKTKTKEGLKKHH